MRLDHPHLNTLRTGYLANLGKDRLAAQQLGARLLRCLGVAVAKGTAPEHQRALHLWVANNLSKCSTVEQLVKGLYQLYPRGKQGGAEKPFVTVAHVEQANSALAPSWVVNFDQDPV